MKRNVVKINESQLRRMVTESIKKVITESFANPDLAEYVKDCGGLVSKPDYPDARNVDGFDIRYARPKGYMNADAVEQMQNCINCFSNDIARCILYTNDGGAIGIEENTYNYPGGREAWEKEVQAPYSHKMYTRGENFTQDNPEDKWGEKWVDKKSYYTPGMYRNNVARERTIAHQKSQKNARKNK